jgi:hypothetical protein
MREKKEWERVGEEEKSTNKQHKDIQKTTKNGLWAYLFSSLTICSSRWQPLFSPPSSHKFAFLKNQQEDQAAHSKLKHTKMNVMRKIVGRSAFVSPLSLP